VPLPFSALFRHLTSLQVICDSVTYTEHAKRKTVTSLDVVYTLKRSGCTLYRYVFYSQLSAAYSLNPFPQFWHMILFAIHSHVIYQSLSRYLGSCPIYEYAHLFTLSTHFNNINLSIQEFRLRCSGIVMLSRRKCKERMTRRKCNRIRQFGY
jgi:hypothetical protein